MIYPFSLSAVAIAVGLLWFLLHLPGLLAPAWTAAAARAFPRHLPTGIALVVLATVWAVALALNIDLGEFSSLRPTITLVALVLGGLMALFSREFLAVRGLSALLLLGANVLLDAAFLRDGSAKLVVVVFAYLWIVAALVFLFSPFRLRDAIALGTATPARTRLLSGLGAGCGLVLIVLGLGVY